jgi:hydroxyacylglutathione hydrolase
MKLKIIASVTILLSIAIKAECQGTSGWFTSKEVGPGVYQIDDHNAVNIYLVTGKDSTLVIDTGMGAADLISCIKKLTSKPLIIVNTHGHSDHTGANFQFKKVYIHPADMKDAETSITPDIRKAAAQNLLRGAKPSDEETFKGEVENTMLVPLREGKVFDLGGRHLKVIETPGHTAGEICLLDVENKLLFTGDNDNTLVWLFLPACRPLHEYLASLEKLQKMLPEFSTILPGHGIPRPSGFINDQVSCVKGIINGTLEAIPYQSFAGNAMMSTFGAASVAFNPKNL